MRSRKRSDRDGADRDQRASDREQAVADVEHRRHHGGPDSERTYDEARAERIDATADRGETAAERDAVDLARGRDAVRRDRTATLRDLSAVERDRAGDVRDRAAERESDALAEGAGAGDAAVEEFLAESARIRVRSSADRARAAVDRGQAATDRAQAAADRRRARIAFQEAQYETLTGVYAHDLGRAALQLEMDDSRRDHRPFVLASIEVEGFDDYRRRRGDAAADALLVAVVDALNSSLVVSDPIVRTRVGEFLCGFAATDLDAALRRVEDICHSLEQGPTGGKVIVSWPAPAAAEASVEACSACCTR